MPVFVAKQWLEIHFLGQFVECDYNFFNLQSLNFYPNFKRNVNITFSRFYIQDIIKTII